MKILEHRPKIIERLAHMKTHRQAIVRRQLQLGFECANLPFTRAVRVKIIQAALDLKRKIDASNQVRTDMVEYIDGYFLQKYAHVQVKPNARINTESPAWAIDRLSILALKIYHMNEEATREEATPEHRAKCQEKLNVLLDQKDDMFISISQLVEDIENGDKFMKIYKQMKMYNDEDLNPVLYQNKK
jgi:hypothetical protein